MEKRQRHAQSDTRQGTLKEVWFPIEKDVDGYPKSRSWEGLWARVTGEGYEILSISFYLKNISRGDFVFVAEGDFLCFTKVAKRGGHNTYRLLMQEATPQQVKDAISELQSRGLTVELNETGILIAVDVPPSVPQQEIDAYLISSKEAGRWQMQDGYLSSVKVE